MVAHISQPGIITIEKIAGYYPDFIKEDAINLIREMIDGGRVALEDGSIIRLCD